MEEIGKIIEERKEIIKNHTKAVITVAEIMKLDFGPELWTVKELIPQYSITAITGAPESFKTWLTLEIAKCISKGTDLLGTFSTNRGNVLIVDKENHRRHIKERLSLLKFENESICYLNENDDFLIDKPKDFQFLMGLIKENNISLVVFDSLIRIHSGVENDARDIAKVMNAFRKITNEKVTVIFIHHNRKENVGVQNTTNSMRGSSDILAGIDCLLQVNKLSEDSIQITQSKLRQGNKIKPFKVQVNSTKESIEFVHAGKSNFTSKETEEVKEIIIDLLKDNTEISRQEIIDGLQEQHKKVIINTSLKELESSEKITKNVIARGKHLFKLNSTSVQSEPNIESEHNDVDPNLLKIEN